LNTTNTVQKIWRLCNVLRGDGVGYNEYISELTYLLFLKIAKETGTEELLPEGYRWDDLFFYKGENLLGHYQEMLTHLGNEADITIRKIYAFPTTVFSHSENLKVVIDGIDSIEWHSFSNDGIGEIYEGLLSKNSEDSRSGAGQYFTPRALVDTIVSVMKPELGEVIQDPACGTGGFLISADKYLRDQHSNKKYKSLSPKYEGMEIEKGTYRLCLMNTFLHEMNSNIILGDALTNDSESLSQADLIIANPPFGSKSGSVRKKRNDIKYSSSNKQLDFLQHIYGCLKVGGRAAVVLPDNVLFEEGIGRKIRQDLMDKCNLHTILRLPSGIFYAHGVNANVLFFNKGVKENENTLNTWIYDLRSDMPNFGKRNPLTYDHFEEFITAYGADKHGKSKRKNNSCKGRFRVFSRSEVYDNDDNLNIKWLKSKDNFGIDGVPDPIIVAADIKKHLDAACSEIEALQSLLDNRVLPNE